RYWTLVHRLSLTRAMAALASSWGRGGAGWMSRSALRSPGQGMCHAAAPRRARAPARAAGRAATLGPVWGEGARGRPGPRSVGAQAAGHRRTANAIGHSPAVRARRELSRARATADGDPARRPREPIRSHRP